MHKMNSHNAVQANVIDGVTEQDNIADHWCGQGCQTGWGVSTPLEFWRGGLNPPMILKKIFF